MPFSACATSLYDISALGIGVELYFWQAKTLGIVLLIMGCCSAPNLHDNWMAAEATPGQKGVLQASTLGMRTEAFNLFPSAMLELLATLVFAVYLVWLRWWNAAKAAGNNKRFITSADFTVAVRGFDFKTSGSELRSFFENSPLEGRKTPPKVAAVELPNHAASEVRASALSPPAGHLNDRPPGPRSRPECRWWRWWRRDARRCARSTR